MFKIWFCVVGIFNWFLLYILSTCLWSIIVYLYFWISMFNLYKWSFEKTHLTRIGTFEPDCSSTRLHDITFILLQKIICLCTYIKINNYIYSPPSQPFIIIYYYITVLPKHWMVLTVISWHTVDSKRMTDRTILWKPQITVSKLTHPALWWPDSFTRERDEWIWNKQITQNYSRLGNTGTRTDEIRNMGTMIHAFWRQYESTILWS